VELAPLRETEEEADHPLAGKQVALVDSLEEEVVAGALL
jgi:hypothetical protein